MVPTTVGPVDTPSPEAPVAPELGPVTFAPTVKAAGVRATLQGVSDQIAGAIRAAEGFGTNAVPRVVGRLRALEKSLASSAVSKAALGQLTREEQWSFGLETGRGLRRLSAAMADVTPKLSASQRREVDATFARLRRALDAGAGALPSVRLPPPLPTTNAQGVRLETSDDALIRFATSLPAELTGTLQEILRANPSDPLDVLDLLKAKPDPVLELKRLDMMFAPADPKVLRRQLSDDLAYGGTTHEADTKAMLEGFGVKDSEPLYGMFATAREAFKRGARGKDEVKPNPMDAASWLHSRLEMPHSLEGLGAIRGTLSADADAAIAWPILSSASWLGTLGSDLYKRTDLHSILTHNRDGAELMVPLLAARHLGDLDAPENHQIVSLAKRFAHDHQIVPADIMVKLMGFVIGGGPVAQRIFAKIADPFAAPSKNGEILFDADELALLREKGIAGWPVPTGEDGPERLLGSLAVIVGDAAQYGCEDAAAKYAVALRGPDKDGAMFSPVISSNAFARLHPERVGELERGTTHEEREGAMESALDGSHDQSVRTILAGSRVFGAELAEAMADHLNAARARTMERLGALTDLADSKIREQAGERPVHYWDVLIPRRAEGEPLAPEVAADVALVRGAFASAIEALFAVPARPFEIEGGAK